MATITTDRPHMTKAQWLLCSDPELMAASIFKNRVSNRQIRLYAAACCRVMYRGGSCQDIVNEVLDVVEKVAEEENSKVLAPLAWLTALAAQEGRTKRLQAARDSISAVRGWFWAATHRDAGVGLLLTMQADDYEMRHMSNDRSYYCVQLADALRDIVGDHFCPPLVLEPALRTPDVLSLAQAAYTERTEDGELDTARLLVLSDALEEAGFQPVSGRSRREVMRLRDSPVGCCDRHADNKACNCLVEASVEEDLLEHLRSSKPHFKGCWALDCVLGKE